MDFQAMFAGKRQFPHSQETTNNTRTFNFVSGSFGGLWLPIDNQGNLGVVPTMIVGLDEMQKYIYKAEVYLASSSQPYRPGLAVNAHLVADKGGALQAELRTVDAIEGAVTAVQALGTGVMERNSKNGSINWNAHMGYFSAYGVSAANATQVFNATINGIRESLDLYMFTSAGTATVTVEGTMDGSHYLTLDSVAAAASTILHYDANSLPSTLAMNVLAFPILKITIGSAGVGNITTCHWGAK